MAELKNAGRAAMAMVLAMGLAGCLTGPSGGGGGGGGGRYVEAFDPTGSALAAAFTRPTREDGVDAALAAHVRTAAFLQQYPATRRKAGCPDRGACTHRVVLVQVDGTGKPVGSTPSCAEISAQLDRDARGQVTVQSVAWTRRAGSCRA
ncbi:MAG: hypothetical protein KIT36_03730 [Alphaproteobacteria bacterium]|nr:hypothetical protein [Alphaproteobacteria bacterium]